MINPKGGSGKTTAAVALAESFACGLGRTLLVDLDPNGGATAAAGVPERAVDRHVGDLIQTPRPSLADLESALWPVREKLTVLPARYGLARAETGGSMLSTAPDRDERLSRVLELVRDRFEWCVVDTGPALSVLAFNAARASDAVVVPADCSSAGCKDSVERAAAALRAMSSGGVTRAAWRLLPVRAGDRAASVSSMEAMCAAFGDRLLRTPTGEAVTIPEDSVFAESALVGRLPGEHGEGRPGVRWVGRAAVALGELLRSGGSRVEGKPGGASVSVARADGVEALFGVVNGLACEMDSGGGAAEEATARASGVEAKPESCSGPRLAVAGGDRSGGGGSRAAELAARTRALSARLADRERAIAADPSLAAAVREAEREGPLRRRA